jgi:hypothetical protein
MSPKKPSSPLAPSRRVTKAPSRTIRQGTRNPVSGRGTTPKYSSSAPSNKGKSNPVSGKPSPGVGKTTPVAPKGPSVPDINSYLGTDATYQDILRGGQRTLADFLSELGRRKGEAETQYGVTKESMERDRVKQLDDLRNEFASRGLINSGLYGQEQGNFQEQFTQQQNALETQQTGLLADLLAQEKNYRREQELAAEAARQEALQRRTAKYNIGA